MQETTDLCTKLYKPTIGRFRHQKVVARRWKWENKREIDNELKLKIKNDKIKKIGLNKKEIRILIMLI